MRQFLYHTRKRLVDTIIFFRYNLQNWRNGPSLRGSGVNEAARRRRTKTEQYNRNYGDAWICSIAAKAASEARWNDDFAGAPAGIARHMLKENVAEAATYLDGKEKRRLELEQLRRRSNGARRLVQIVDCGDSFSEILVAAWNRRKLLVWRKHCSGFETVNGRSPERVVGS